MILISWDRRRTNSFVIRLSSLPLSAPNSISSGEALGWREATIGFSNTLLNDPEDPDKKESCSKTYMYLYFKTKQIFGKSWHFLWSYRLNIFFPFSIDIIHVRVPVCSWHFLKVNCCKDQVTYQVIQDCRIPQLKRIPAGHFVLGFQSTLLFLV